MVFLILTIDCGEAGGVYSEEPLEEASSDVLFGFLSYCKTYMLEENVEEHYLNRYLFACMNNMLIENYYKQIYVISAEE